MKPALDENLSRLHAPTLMTGSLADITEPRLAADALRESEARFRNLTEISSDFFWETDAEHRYSSIEFGEAFDYSGADFRRWCTEVGFRRFEVLPLAGSSSAAIAYK